jgi:hypothetical protein
MLNQTLRILSVALVLAFPSAGLLGANENLTGIEPPASSPVPLNSVRFWCKASSVKTSLALRTSTDPKKVFQVQPELHKQNTSFVVRVDKDQQLLYYTYVFFDGDGASKAFMTTNAYVNPKICTTRGGLLVIFP